MLSSNNNQLFLEYFKNETKRLIENHLTDFESKKPSKIPNEFWINHITATFIETLKWWIENKMKETPEMINEYFLLLI